MSVVATPEGLAGFAWLFDGWSQMITTMVVSTSPLFVVISNNSVAFSSGIAAIWLVLMMRQVAERGLAAGLWGGLLVYFVVFLGVQPATLTIGGVSVQMTQMQKIGYILTMSVHKHGQAALAAALDKQMINGSIIPAQSALDRLLDRSTALYERTDLARLIRDYNTSCSPSPSELAGPENATKVESLHAVGLAGGGGLGVPDSEITLIAQARSVGSGLYNAFFGGDDASGSTIDWMTGGSISNSANAVLDLGKIRSRREAGMEYLKALDTPFMGDSYSLPSQQSWQAKFSGKSDAVASYIPISKIPSQKSAIVNPESEPIRFTPSSCAEAYQIAQLGAEAAYLALRESGASVGTGRQVSAEVGAVSSAMAWQQLMSQSLQKTTGLGAGAAEGASGILAAKQMFSDAAGWIDLQTTFVGYVTVAAVLYGLVLLLAPLVLVIAPIMGLPVLLNWIKLLFLPVAVVFITHLLVIFISLLMSAAAIGQSAMAAGWHDGGVDFAAFRGMLGTVAAALLTLGGWLAARFVGVNLMGLDGAMKGVATGTAAGAAIVSGVSAVVGGSVKKAMASAATDKAPRNNNAGGSGGSVSAIGGANAQAVNVTNSMRSESSSHASYKQSSDSSAGKLNPPKLPPKKE